jgi:uncharacterized membrane protein
VEFPVKGTWSWCSSRIRRARDQRAHPGRDDNIGVLPALHAESDHGLLLLPAPADVIELSMSVDDAAKLVMSAGVIQPTKPSAACK